jgi:arabinan endo-1,5-alpha-L-arabinosidase
MCSASASRGRAPHGPFHSIGSDPLVCQPGDADAIDPKPFTDTDGRQYLLYSASREGNATIWLQRLDAGGTGTIGQRRRWSERTEPTKIMW